MKLLKDEFTSLKFQRKMSDPRNLMDKGGPLFYDEESIQAHELNNRILEVLFTKAQTIVFSSEQAEIFWSKPNKTFDHIEFMLPFPSVVIQFSDPLGIEFTDLDDEKCRGILVAQSKLEKKHIKQYVPKMWSGFKKVFNTPSDYIWEISATVLGETIVASFVWFESNGEISVSPHIESGGKNMHLIRSIIGYINCENVYLHKEGEVDEAINRKRERKGKRRLEPYYVCRIRGVNYESQATGDGTKHGHRYDVRGHFRRLDDGRVTWVRPHQRGLANELYIPKVYKVDKE